MARIGDWRNDKDEEIELDGIGGVNIMVKADVHRSGMWHCNPFLTSFTDSHQASTFPAMLSRTRPRPRASPRWPSAPATESMVSPTMWSGTLTPRKSPATHKTHAAGLGDMLPRRAYLRLEGRFWLSSRTPQQDRASRHGPLYENPRHTHTHTHTQQIIRCSATSKKNRRWGRERLESFLSLHRTATRRRRTL